MIHGGILYPAGTHYPANDLTVITVLPSVPAVIHSDDDSTADAGDNGPSWSLANNGSVLGQK